MAQKPVKDPNSVRLVRHFDASPERVFDAWINPEIAALWLFTEPISEKHTTEIDARVGGQYSISDWREGTKYTAVGEYLVVDRPRKLVFTFGMPQFSKDFDRITVDIEPDGDGCILSMTQEDVRTGYQKSTKRGWNKMMLRLAEVLEAK